MQSEQDHQLAAFAQFKFKIQGSFVSVCWCVCVYAEISTSYNLLRTLLQLALVIVLLQHSRHSLAGA